MSIFIKCCRSSYGSMIRRYLVYVYVCIRVCMWKKSNWLSVRANRRFTSFSRRKISLSWFLILCLIWSVSCFTFKHCDCILEIWFWWCSDTAFDLVAFLLFIARYRKRFFRVFLFEILIFFFFNASDIQNFPSTTSCSMKLNLDDEIVYIDIFSTIYYWLIKIDAMDDFDFSSRNGKKFRFSSIDPISSISSFLK